MTQHCRPAFDEALLSGYVDGELTQSDNQRVRLHLENCSSCRHLVDDLVRIREAAMTTDFPVPTDEEWREEPKGPGNRWLRRLGWILIIAWFSGATAMLLHGFIQGSATWYQKTLIIALGGGVLLLLLSVLIDRFHALKSDRYGRVQK